MKNIVYNLDQNFNSSIQESLFMNKIALIDAYGFVFRAYHSLPPLTRADGTPVGAVYGFTNMLIKLIASLDVSHVAVVFDSGSKTFRNEIFSEYKANRPPCPEDLKPQFPIIRKTAESLNLTILEKVGYEADDIIATIAKKSAQANFEVLIISSDKDLMQLIDDKISIYDAMKNKLIKSNEVKEKFFVEPHQVLDLLSLIGDSSDNVPGVKGIGPKTASELINQYGTLENIFKNIDNIKQEKRKKLLNEGIENALLSKKLITLKEDVELKITLDDLQVKEINPHKLINFLKEQGFRSLVLKVEKEFSINSKDLENKSSSQIFINQHQNNFETDQIANNANNQVKQVAVEAVAEIKDIYQQAKIKGVVLIDYFIKNDQLNFLTISIADKNEIPKQIYYCNFLNSNSTNFQANNFDLFNYNNNTNQNSENSLTIDNFAEIIFDNSIRKIFFDAKNFLRFFKNNYRLKDYNKCLQSIILDDINLMNYLSNSAIHNNLRELIDSNLDNDLEELGYGKIIDELEKKGDDIIFEDDQKKINFFCFKNLAIHQLYKIFSNKIFDLKMNNAYYSYELPLIEVLSQMEFNGIKIDIEKLNSLSKEFANKIADLSQQIYQLSGTEFNISSSKQLSEILFNKLGFESSKKSKKTGALSTKAKVLEDLANDGNQIAEKIIEFRKFSKLKNTYTDALPKQINQITNRIHTHFSNTSTLTGRLSSINPNLQNIPIKNHEGKKIRQCFIASKDHILISADYSQIELRVIAHIAKIKNLIEAFKLDKDIHKITASEVFNIDESLVDEETRSKAKAINFGIIYGISAYGLAKQLKISNSEAGDYIKSYFNTYPGIEEYMKNNIDYARKNSYVKTISGRKCYIKNINDKNPIVRQEAERQAINASIQGSSADIIKKAMINIHQKIIQQNLKSKLVLQIHDELVIESSIKEADIISNILCSEMEKSFNLDVPLKVDLNKTFFLQ